MKIANECFFPANELTMPDSLEENIRWQSEEVKG